MRILYLPDNVASIPSITAEAMNAIDGVEAICLTAHRHKYQVIQKHTIYFPRFASKRNPAEWLKAKFTYSRRILKWIKWADVLHYTWSSALTDGRDLKYAHKLGKKIFVEWVGSDIRNPDILLPINPYYRAVWDNGYEYRHLESNEQSLANQKMFSAVGATPLYFPEMKMYINRALFPTIKLLPQRINCDEYVPQYPDTQNTRPLIVHSPSAKVGKGSAYIIAALESLKAQYDFDFILLNNITRDEVHKVMQKADIFIDQVIGGGFGMAALEAMSFGKPVFAYLMPALFDCGLDASNPIVNVTIDTIQEYLAKYIADPLLRHNTGKDSRAYVERFHNVKTIAKDLAKIYTEN